MSPFFCRTNGGFEMDFTTAFLQFDEDTRRVIFAALWAGMDVHAPLDNLSKLQWKMLEEFANFANMQLTERVF